MFCLRTIFFASPHRRSLMSAFCFGSLLLLSLYSPIFEASRVDKESVALPLEKSAPQDLCCCKLVQTGKSCVGLSTSVKENVQDYGVTICCEWSRDKVGIAILLQKPGTCAAGLTSLPAQMCLQNGNELKVQELPANIVSTLTNLYRGGPQGRFLQQQRGVTHFHIAEPAPEVVRGQKRRWAVLAHGIGTSMMVYSGPIRDQLVAAGFHVLSYDFYGHHWSVARKECFVYDADTFLKQVTELMDFVMEEGEAIDLFVGHSTGGVVGSLLASQGKRPMRHLALISPALWASKPLIAKITDSMPPSAVHLACSKLHKTLVLPNYLESNKRAYAKRYSGFLYPEKKAARDAIIQEEFKNHPQISGAVLSVSNWFLNPASIRAARHQFMKKVEDAPHFPKVSLLWGKFDVVVPYKHSQEMLRWGRDHPGRISLISLEAGHESVDEIPETIARELVGLSAPDEASEEQDLL